MVMRKIVVVGDKTTTSGTILPNANSTLWSAMPTIRLP